MSKSYATYTSQTFLGTVVENPTDNSRRIQLNAPDYYQHYLKTTCGLGDAVSLYITNKKPKRTDRQNRYLHLYLSLIALSSGHTVDELKSWVKGKFLSKGITEVFGDKVRIVKSTTQLNKLEFIELLERIEHETEIPLPKTDKFLDPLSHEEYQNLKEEQKRVYSQLVAKNICVKK